MKFEKALSEATTKKETTEFISKKKKEWKGKNKKNSGVTAVSSEDTGVTGDYEKMFKKK